MHATLMAIKPPTPPAEDFLIEVQCQDGEEEPSYARVVAAVRKMCKKSDDAPIAIGIDASTTPMSDERASANHLVRVLAGLSSDAQRERVWRRFKNYEKYLA